MTSAYLDASAVVKLFKEEAESEALVAELSPRASLVSSELVAVEARCTARRLDRPDLFAGAERALATIELIAFDADILARAGGSFQPALSVLDAIHAASALSVRDDLEAVFVYDVDLRSALATEGLRVVSPGVGI